MVVCSMVVFSIVGGSGRGLRSGRETREKARAGAVVERRRGVGWLGGEMKAKGMLTFGAINRVSTRLSRAKGFALGYPRSARLDWRGGTDLREAQATRSEAVAIALRKHLLKM